MYSYCACMWNSETNIQILHVSPICGILHVSPICGKPWRKALYDLLIEENDLWSSTDYHEKCLWNAKIFPILSYFEMLSVATWLMGLNDEDLISLWRTSSRVSLEELHRSIDFSKMSSGSINHQADLAAAVAKACIGYGMVGCSLSLLCDEILQRENVGVKICNEFLDLCPALLEQNCKILPKSRAYQVQVDLLRACNNKTGACKLETKVWAAVADETASAVKYGFKEFHSLPGRMFLVAAEVVKALLQITDGDESNENVARLVLVSSIKRLAELAKIGREALMNCDIDDLGDIMLEAWRLHQELDHYCSNEFVDKLFEFAHPYCSGYKLVGAGGGGFALLLMSRQRNLHICSKMIQTLTSKCTNGTSS